MASDVESADLIENDVLAAVGVACVGGAVAVSVEQLMDGRMVAVGVAIAAVVGLALTGPRSRHHIHIPSSRYDQLVLRFDAATDVVDILHSAHCDFFACELASQIAHRLCIQAQALIRFDRAAVDQLAPELQINL